MEKINICFTSPAKNAYSETFIQNLRQIIDGNVFYCYGGYFPVESEDGKLKSHYDAPLPVRGLSRMGLISKPPREIYLESYLKKNNIKLIIANYGQSGAELCGVSERLEIPLIVHFHGFDASVDKVLQQYEDGYRKMFKIAKCIVVVSNEMKNKIIGLGANENKVFLMRYAPASSFSSIVPDYQSKQVLAIGRFVEKKAPYLTLLAFKQAQGICPDLKIKFIGHGELVQVCKDIAKGLNIQHVDFAGVMSPAAIATEMSRSFCFIQHSKTAASGDKEGTPVAVLEAMSSALPVISTYHAGIPDVITSNENGILVEEGDVDGMAQAIVKLDQDRLFAENLGKRGRAYILGNLTQAKYKSDWDNLIQRVVHGN